MNILSQHIKEINGLCASHRLKSLFAFGSAIRSDFKKDSDIDLIVEFEPLEHKKYADNYFELKFSLEKLLKHPIDLLESKAIKNPYFKSNIEGQMQRIYGH
ncbi:MAG: nucleotidyltransferase family protein [Candidatus Methylopumilus sp.]